MNRIHTSAGRLAVFIGCSAFALAAQADTGAAGKPSAPAASAAKASGAKTTIASTNPSTAKSRPLGPWVQAPSKHSGSGIRLRYRTPDAVQPGEAITLELQFSGVTAPDAQVELRGPEGSSLSAADGSALSRVALPVGQTTTVAVRLVPTGDGLQTLDVFTSQAERSSVQSVPVKVGSGRKQLKTQGKLETTPSGEKVISLPSTPAK